MSYNDIQPEYYEMFRPGMPWHAGGTGWTRAPFPGWGQNPNLVGPARLAVNGLGAYYQERANLAISPLGQAQTSVRGVVTAMLAISALTVAGAMLFAPKKRYVSNRRRRRNYRRNRRTR